MASFRPTRGHSLMVFDLIDTDRNGKVTRTEMEDAAGLLGLSLEKANNLFERLDKHKRGYLDMCEWGQVETYETVETFTLLYMRRCLGLPDMTSTKEQVDIYLKSQGLKLVKSLPAAINLVASNGVTRGSGRQTNIIHDSFR